MTRILFLASGVYPHYMGGVSTWADILLRGLKDYDFDIVSVVSNPHVALRYKLPPNVGRLVTLPLWGGELPEEYVQADLFAYVRRRFATSKTAVRAHFIPHFETFLEQIGSGASDPEQLGQSLAAMSDFFVSHDFIETMRGQATWDTFIAFLHADPLFASMSVAEAIDNMRLLARHLRVLLVRPRRADLVHSAIASVAGVIGVVAKIQYGIPYLLTEHGVYIRERMLDLVNQNMPPPTKVLAHHFHSALTRLNYAYADLITPVCNFNARWEAHYGVPPARVRTVYNGVDTALFAPEAATDPERPTVVAVIRIDRLKDPLNLIRAIACVRRQVPNVLCRIFGPAPDLEYARACELVRAELNLVSTVSFEGFTRNPERAYHLGDVVVMSSISEGFPFALIEAMAAGKAIVATDVGGVREALGQAGVVVPPRQPQPLADAITTLLRDPALRTELGRRARERAMELFQLGSVIDQYRTVYEELTA